MYFTKWVLIKWFTITTKKNIILNFNIRYHENYDILDFYKSWKGRCFGYLYLLSKFIPWVFEHRVYIFYKQELDEIIGRVHILLQYFKYLIYYEYWSKSYYGRLFI